MRFIAPTPPVTFPTPCQQFPAYTMPAVTNGVSLTPSVLCTCHVLLLLWKPSASRVVGSLPLLDEFAAPVHQEQHTAEQVVHVPIPQIQEQCVEGVKCDPSGTFS